MAMSHLELDNAIIQASQQLGYATIRPEQNRAIKSSMEGRDVFISLPTGRRKSICFSVLPYAFDYLYKRVGSIVVVVSPLIAKYWAIPFNAQTIPFNAQTEGDL